MRRSLRKVLLVAAVSIIGWLGGADRAQAQFPPTEGFARAICQLNTVVPNLRAEGLAERIGNIRISCIATIGRFLIRPEQVYTLVNLGVTLNVSVTNRVNIYGAPGFVDAVLTINGQDSYRPLLISETDYANQLGGLVGVNETFPSQCPSYLNPNITTSRPFAPVFFDPRWPCPQLARKEGPRRVVWDGVKVPFPGVDAAVAQPPFGPNIVPSFPEITRIEITNIRANAAELGVTPDTNPGTVQVTATIDISGPSTLSFTRNTANVGIPHVALLTRFDAGAVGLQCVTDSGHVTVTLDEGFASAFKTLGAPTFGRPFDQAENGYPALDGGTVTIGPPLPITVPAAGPFSSPGLNSGTGGGATQATRFMVRLAGIPGGVVTTVPKIINNESGETGCEPDPDFTGLLCLQLVLGTDENGAGGSTSSGDGAGDLYTVPLDASGNGFVIYEVKDGDPFLPESIDIPIWFDWTYNPASDFPEIGSGQVDVRLAPLSDVGICSNEPTPRFVDVGDDPFTVLTIVRCSTTLLFPFVTNRHGFDTGIAVSNTSEDWKGTPNQRGTCMVHYIGDIGDNRPRVPMDETSTIIEGGEQMTFTLSAGNPVWDLVGAPDFQGFLVVMCEFQFAHGYAFVTDGAAGIPTLAQGYLALVLQYDSAGDRLRDCHRPGLDGGNGKGLAVINGAGGRHLGCPSEGLNH